MTMQHEYPLKIVEEIARSGSIRGAADMLSITPSALNRRLLSLEDELETQLFERTSQGVLLNAAGEIFITHARRQLADMKSVRSKIADLKGARRGRVTIAIDDNIANIESFAQEVAAYQSEFDGVAFAIEPTTADDIAQFLIEYRADLALQLHPRTNSHVSSLCSAPAGIVVTGRKNHPALHDGPLRLHEITQYLWTLPPRGPLRKAIETSASSQGLEYRVGLEASSGFAIPILQGSDTIGFEIAIGTPKHSSSHIYRRTLSPRDHTPLFLHLSQLKGRSLSVAAGRFAEQVKKSYAVLGV
ncbi:LysR family transcriptional regulator [uncultured Tateyamaria sp.]|nr:LysR family transcriptional regulator [uncultured Tateyamaria sp.]